METIAEVLEDLPRAVAADTALRRIGRHCTAEILLEVGASAFHLVVDRKGRTVAGLSQDAIQACLADEANINRVLTTRLRAQAELDVTSTPTFFINGRVVRGALDFDEYAQVIDE